MWLSTGVDVIRNHSFVFATNSLGSNQYARKLHIAIISENTKQLKLSAFKADDILCLLPCRDDVKLKIYYEEQACKNLSHNGRSIQKITGKILFSQTASLELQQS